MELYGGIVSLETNQYSMALQILTYVLDIEFRNSDFL